VTKRHAVIAVAIAFGCASAYPFTVTAPCVAGVPSGRYLATNAGGDRIAGGFCEGVRCGRFSIFVRSDVHIADFPYRDGQLHGELELWYQPASAPNYLSRLKARFLYSVGYRDGLSSYWCPNGRRLAEVLYAAGVMSSASAWECNGKPLSGRSADSLARRLLDSDRTYFAILESTLDEAAPSCDRRQTKR
jgi:hypothetical protein